MKSVALFILSLPIFALSLTLTGYVGGKPAKPAPAAERLRLAGFSDIDTNLEEAMTTLATEADYREFVTTVIFHPYLAMLPDAALKQDFIDRVTEDSAKQDSPFTLDYWRLNIKARRA